MRLRSDWGRSEGRKWRGGENLGKWTENKRGRKMEEAKRCKDIRQMKSSQIYPPIRIPR
jgi:hypothetical protein